MYIKKERNIRTKKVNKSGTLSFNCVLYLKSINHFLFHPATAFFSPRFDVAEKVLHTQSNESVSCQTLFFIHATLSLMHSSEMDLKQYSVFSSSISTTRSVGVELTLTVIYIVHDPIVNLQPSRDSSGSSVSP